MVRLEAASTLSVGAVPMVRSSGYHRGMATALTAASDILSSLPIGGRDEVTGALARRIREFFGADGVSILIPSPDRWAVETAMRLGRVARTDRPGSAWRSCHGEAGAVAPVPASRAGSPVALLKLYRDTPFDAEERRALHDLARAVAAPIRDADAFDELHAPL